jgi:hypothetical protein
VPPPILAVVMALQRLEGLSDREAADRFAFDVRWRYAAGVADAVAGEETASFAHTVLVDLRARLRRSEDPDRIFRVTCQLGPPGGAGRGAAGAGLGPVGGRGRHPGHRDHAAGRDPGAAARLPTGAGGPSDSVMVMSRPVKRTAWRELAKRRTSPNSAQIATAVSQPTP